MPNLSFEIVTAERVVYSDDVDVVVAPGIDGELGLLPNHAPLLTLLKPGEIRLIKDGEETDVAVTGGFLELFANKVTILADSAERAEEIDAERAQEAMRRARERIQSSASDSDLARAVASMRRAEVRFRVAQRKRRTR